MFNYRQQSKNPVVKRDTGSTTCNNNHASKNSNAVKNGQSKKFKDLTNTNVLGDVSDTFSKFVKQNLDQQGIDFDSLEEEERQLIFDAIKKTLMENEIVESLQAGSNKPAKSNTNKNIPKKVRRHSNKKE